MNLQEMFELASLDALGLLDEEERGRYDTAFRAASPEIQAQIRREQLRWTHDAEVHLPEIRPSEDLSSRVLDAVRAAMLEVDAREYQPSPSSEQRIPHVRVVRFTEEILRAIEMDPTTLHKIDEGQFEEFVGNQLDKMGYDVTYTGKTNAADGGIDLVGRLRSNSSVLIAVEAKHRKPGISVGPQAVDRLASWKGREFAFGMLVTNTQFTDDAVWTAKTRHKFFLRLREFEQLAAWVRGNYDAVFSADEIPTQIEIRPGLWLPLPPLPPPRPRGGDAAGDT